MRSRPIFARRYDRISWGSVSRGFPFRRQSSDRSRAIAKGRLNRLHVNEDMVFGVVLSSRIFWFWSRYNGHGGKELGRASGR